MDHRTRHEKVKYRKQSFACLIFRILNVIVDDFVHEPLKILFSGLIFAKNLVFWRKTTNIKISELHFDHLISGLKLIILFQSPNLNLILYKDFNDIFLRFYQKNTLAAKTDFMIPTILILISVAFYNNYLNSIVQIYS